MAEGLSTACWTRMRTPHARLPARPPACCSLAHLSARPPARSLSACSLAHAPADYSVVASTGDAHLMSDSAAPSRHRYCMRSPAPGTTPEAAPSACPLPADAQRMFVDAAAVLTRDRERSCQQLRSAADGASFAHPLPGVCHLTGEGCEGRREGCGAMGVWAGAGWGSGQHGVDRLTGPGQRKAGHGSLPSGKACQSRAEQARTVQDSTPQGNARQAQGSSRSGQRMYCLLYCTLWVREQVQGGRVVTWPTVHSPSACHSPCPPALPPV